MRTGFDLQFAVDVFDVREWVLNLVASEAGNVGTIAIVNNAEEAANLTASNLAPYIAVVEAAQLETQKYAPN